GARVVAAETFVPGSRCRVGRVPGRLREGVGKLAWRDCGRVFRKADRVTTPTPLAAALLAEQGFDRPVEPVSCGIDLARFHPHAEPKAWARKLFGRPDRPTVLFVGRLDEEKRLSDRSEERRVGNGWCT